MVLDWCKSQDKGIRAVVPNFTVSKAYLDDAQNTLLDLQQISGKWQTIMAYYACYNSLYALCVKAGIKCEIHDCTLKLLPFFGFSQKDCGFMEDLKKKRISVQYYLGNETVDTKNVKLFHASCLDKYESDLSKVAIEVFKK
jgi:uncharacterized protein (UPF0332 family)